MWYCFFSLRALFKLLMKIDSLVLELQQSFVNMKCLCCNY